MRHDDEINLVNSLPGHTVTCVLSSVVSRGVLLDGEVGQAALLVMASAGGGN